VPDSKPAAARHFLVIPAAGSGRRMVAAKPKQYLQIAGKTLLQLTLERLGAMPWFSRIVVVLAEDDRHWPGVAAALDAALQEKLQTVVGGSERYRSVANALTALAGLARENDWVLVHDAVRPCVLASDIAHLVESLVDEHAGGLLAVPVKDTLKEARGDGEREQLVQRTVDRSRFWLAATPQMFRYGVLQKALQAAIAAGLGATDEAAAVERLGMPVRLVTGRADNLKVTYPEDLALAAAILQAQAQGQTPGQKEPR
jgi:2-C-methyl-D-erythritol 4-phosphate cytidylyltransferase